jgi:hypothetical protein
MDLTAKQSITFISREILATVDPRHVMAALNLMEFLAEISQAPE